MREFFNQYGNIEYFRCMTNAKKGTYRYGFIILDTVEAAMAILEVKNFKFNGKKMAVKKVNKLEVKEIT